MMKDFWRRSLQAVVMASLLSSAGALAQDSDPQPEWSFEFTPYLWLAGLDGNLGVAPRLPTATVDAGFSDILQHLDAGFMAVGEVRRGRYVLFGDMSYIKLSADARNSGPLLGAATVHAKSFGSTLEGGYRFYDTPSLSVDGLAGARIFSIHNQIDFAGGLLPATSQESGETWVVPVVGAHLRAPLAEGLFADGYADAGSLGTTSDHTWQVYGGLGYRISSVVTAYAGYRYLDAYHSDGGFLYDASQQGPLLGLGIAF